jgi:hypothetical protein
LLAFSNLLEKGSLEIEFVVLGGSMGKAVPSGSRIRIRFASGSKLAPGQIVAYVANDRIVVHRLVELATSRDIRYAITRGDATVCCDAPVPTSTVIGIVTKLHADGAWETVPQLEIPSFGFRCVAAATTRMLLMALALNPSLSVWVASRTFKVRGLTIRGLQLIKRQSRLPLSDEPNH